MDSSIWAEVSVHSPKNCPVAQVSGEANATSHSVSKSVDPESPSEVTEEFELDRDVTLSEHDLSVDDAEEVFSTDTKHVYRFRRQVDRDCPCECVERFDCPVTEVHTRDGTLYLTFHVTNSDQLQSVITHLKDSHGAVEIERLLKSPPDGDEARLVTFDQNELTDRQLEVVDTAYEMGYFEHPKDANAGDVAERLGVTTATFTEHLAAAHRKVLDAVVTD